MGEEMGRHARRSFGDMAHLLFEVFKVGFLVEGDLRHVLEEPPDLDAAELDGRVQVQGLKVLLKVVVSHLHTHFSIPYILSMKNQIAAHKGEIVSLSADYQPTKSGLWNF